MKGAFWPYFGTWSGKLTVPFLFDINRHLLYLFPQRGLRSLRIIKLFLLGLQLIRCCRKIFFVHFLGFKVFSMGMHSFFLNYTWGHEDWSSPCFQDCRGDIRILLIIIINTQFDIKRTISHHDCKIRESFETFLGIKEISECLKHTYIMHFLLIC